MKIVFFEAENWEKEAMNSIHDSHDVFFIDEPLSSINVNEAEDADIVSVFVYSKLDETTLPSMPNLKFITTRSMGYDHINLELCKQKNIAVSRVPAYGDHTVAEHTFALILGISRKVYLAYERTEKHIFDYHGLQGIDLHGKTLGLVGCGKIGANVARIANGFGMKVIVSDPMPNEELAKEIGFTYVEFEELLTNSDVISLHAPLLPQTRHMINDEAISKMKKGVILVNTARGSLIDTKALLHGLEQGIVSGAGLDVVEEECALKEETELMGRDFPKKCDLGALVRNHMLIARDDVIITPHIGFNSHEATHKIMEVTEENILAFIANKPINIVS